MDNLKMHSPDLSQDNIAKIRDLFPSCVTEAHDEKTGELCLSVDFDQLRQELSGSIVEGPQERYRMDWPGKREALDLANTRIYKALRPVRDESVNFDTTRNLFIEGDNLEALKLLQETYLGKIRMIYIDPPYNTGKDFIYRDNFRQSRKDFEQENGDRNGDGERLVANTNANGRFHSDWLSMMYPRLKIARNIMHDEGVIFISIDDNEVGNLINLGKEIFGEENFIGSISWLKKRKGSFLSKTIVSVTEWLLVFGKSNNVRLFGGKLDENESQPLVKRTNTLSILSFPQASIETRLKDGKYKSGVYGRGSSSVESLCDFVVKSGIITSSLRLKGPFTWSQRYLDDQIRRGARLIVNTENIQVRAFKAPDKNSFKGVLSLINGVEISATNEDAYEELSNLLGGEGIMSYPKPVNYVKKLIEALTHWDKSSIILDFFAGSSTTAHAAMKLNAEDGGNRRFIMVQYPEPCNENSQAFKAGFETISEISKERIRRAGKKILESECHPDWNRDIGFRALRVDTSNMKDVYCRPDQVKQSELKGMVDNVKRDRTPEDMLFQVLLDLGVDPTLPIGTETIQDKTLFFVDDKALVACFDHGVSEDLVREVVKCNPLRAVFLDNGFASDAVKINVEQIFRQISPATEFKAI